MLHSHRRSVRTVFAVFAALATLLLVTLPSSAAEPGTTGTPAFGAADWLATELEAKDGMLTVTFGGPDEFADQGLTIDAILGIIAAGQGDDPAVDLALDALAYPANLMPYITGFETDADRAANATAKALLLEEISGVDVSDGIDLESDLRGLIETDGLDQGRFSDTDSLGFGNFANTIGQSLAILGLDRTGGVPGDAVDFLLGEQCPNGSFRLFHTDPTPPTDPHVCTDNTQGDPDATAFALMALLVLPSSPGIDVAIDDAVDHLLGQQQSSGGFVGTGVVNSNTTGLATSALRAAGEDEAADDGAAHLAGLQDAACAEFGSIAYNQAAFDAGIAADRGQWTRATAQGILGLGLPDYGGVGTVTPVVAGLTDISCPAAPVVPKGAADVTSIVAGGTVHLTAEGFAPGETVDVSLHSTPIALGTLTADPSGEVEGDVTIPADVEPGPHTIVMVGQTSGTTVEVALTVDAPAGAEDPGNLPATGSHAAALTVVGVAFLALGAALVAESLRRRAGVRAT